MNYFWSLIWILIHGFSVWGIKIILDYFNINGVIVQFLIMGFLSTLISGIIRRLTSEKRFNAFKVYVFWSLANSLFIWIGFMLKPYIRQEVLFYLFIGLIMVLGARIIRAFKLVPDFRKGKIWKSGTQKTGNYLIEFRFFGKSKMQIKDMIRQINKKFSIYSRYRSVPHVTLAGGFKTNDEKRLISDFREICKKYSIMEYDVDGFDTFDDSKVVYIKIKPTKKLEDFRWELSKTVGEYSSLTEFDKVKEFHFHATLAMKLKDDKFKEIKRYVNTFEKPNYKHTLLRATLLRNGKILYEYDFILKRMLDRNLAKDRSILNETFRKLLN